MSKTIRILLADDHPIVLSGLRALLEREHDVAVVGVATNGRDAVRLAAELAPDVVVMDLAMPELNGIEATRQARALQPDLKIIALSAHADDRSTVEMMRAGAVGYILKDMAYEELLTAIRTVVQNKVYLGCAMMARLADGLTAHDGKDGKSAERSLSAREREVVQLIAEGKATKEVAAALQVSIKTVETHRRNLMEKLGADSVAEVVKYAIREGLTKA